MQKQAEGEQKEKQSSSDEESIQIFFLTGVNSLKPRDATARTSNLLVAPKQNKQSLIIALRTNAVRAKNFLSSKG